MAPTHEQLKSDLTAKIIALGHEQLEKPIAAQFESFAKQFYANVAAEDLIGQNAANLYGAALAMFSFIKQRAAGAAMVRVYNPRPEEHGWKSTHSIVEIVNDDMPFLVDSVTMELARINAEVYLITHPLLLVERDPSGKLKTLHEPGAEGEGITAESIIQIQIAEQPEDMLGEITERLQQILIDVRAVVTDWPEMRERCAQVIDELEAAPPPVDKSDFDTSLAFLKWLNDDHFTYLGYREYNFAESDSNGIKRRPANGGLGLLRDPDVRVIKGLRTLDKLPAEIRAYLTKAEILRISKSDERSSVHRAVLMESIMVKKINASGEVVGERHFLGLFTSSAYSRSPSEIPLLREKVARTIARAGFAPRSHDGKALAHILTTYPRDELFQSDPDELYTTAMGILHLQERSRIAVFARHDPFKRFVSVLVYIPRERFDTKLRQRVQDILSRAYGGEVSAYYTHLTDEALARLHVLIKTSHEEETSVDLTMLEKQIIDAARSWNDQLKEALIESRGEAQGLSSMRQFTDAFPAGYQEQVTPQAAVFDLSKVEDAIDSGQMTMNLYRPVTADPDYLRFKIYIVDGPIPLSDVLPMLENMGLRVIGEAPYAIRPQHHDSKIWIHDFETRTQDGKSVDLAKIRDAFQDTFYKVWTADMENDGFNTLVLSAGLTADHVKVMRAYCKYLLQARAPFSQIYMEQTLRDNPEITRRLAALFESRFNPSHTDGGASEAEQLVDQVKDLLNDVSNLDEDRIIRRYLNVILSTLRTNFYRAGAEGKERHCISFKIDSKAIEELPLPRPYREIFVYSPRVEGIHLRFGKVARGGLRWSDRREDFRTEILGLVKAQHVKNAVIVPVGSKGGFYVKTRHAPGTPRESVMSEGIECYKTFLRGLLDVTDNIKSGTITPPPFVVRHDDDDPYLVVAADKGTATFSDIANSVSSEYDFWLDDAFASGGSVGYDHKKMAITARGAWESVKRHFRELGKDCQSEDFTCVGVGDMAGDVFGNGMLLSKHIKLIAAFNHMHIFIDPDPDPAASWDERKRLFDLPRSSWTDYNSELISSGGALFERKSKSLTLTAEMKELFSISADQLTPDELIKAILQADAELLWFGGIGTYVKAASESHVDVGDRANDNLRVNAAKLGAKIVGEGANLGMTQLGRIEYGFKGGHSNTDAIDNSAGVDCSDHEVNIKILLGDVESAGDMTRKQRDILLAQMTDEVAQLVLRDNYLQGQAITATMQAGRKLTDRITRFMSALEKNDQLDRDVENLPDDDTISERRKNSLGFVRPEIAVLLSYAKITLYDDILSSNLMDDAYLNRDLISYFPAPLRDTYSGQINNHRLKLEIAATAISNEIVNRMGLTFVHELNEKTGLPADDIARAYIVSREIFGMMSLWTDIEALDNIASAQTQSMMLLECSRLLKRQAIWFLRERSQPLDIAREIAAFGPGVAELIENVGSMTSKNVKELMDSQTQELTAANVPPALARRITELSQLTPSCDIARIASKDSKSVTSVAQVYFNVGERFGFDWLRRLAGHIPNDSVWDKQAVTAVIDDLFGHQSELTQRIMDVVGNGEVNGVIDDWADGRKPQVERTRQLLGELKTAGTPDLAMLAVANRQLKSLVSS